MNPTPSPVPNLPVPDPLSGLPAHALAGTCWRYALRPGRDADAPLVIAAHGSDRDVAGLLSGLDLEGAVSLLVPLFPAHCGGEDISDDYKFLNLGATNYLELMDRILREAIDRLQARPRKLFLFGFSGGAQFVQRFALFRAKDLAGVIIAAPGSVTLMRDDVAWWPGLKDAEESVMEPLDLTGLKALRTAILVGADDRSSSLVDRGPGARFGSSDAGLAGATRVDKARALHMSLSAFGTPATITELPGVGHQLAPCAEAASQILRDWLFEERASTNSSIVRRQS